MNEEYSVGYEAGYQDGWNAAVEQTVRTKDYNPDVNFNDDGTFSLTLPDGDELRIIPPQQEPTAEVSEDGYAWGKDGILPAGTKLYTRPVLTKDLTENEINDVMERGCYERGCCCYDDRVDKDGVVVSMVEVSGNEHGSR